MTIATKEMPERRNEGRTKRRSMQQYENLLMQCVAGKEAEVVPIATGT